MTVQTILIQAQDATDEAGAGSVRTVTDDLGIATTVQIVDTKRIRREKANTMVAAEGVTTEETVMTSITKEITNLELRSVAAVEMTRKIVINKIRDKVIRGIRTWLKVQVTARKIIETG